ncbi:dynamin family protein [Aeromicrobium duanguangcaii]|uniref:Dynamin family protein n=1 Tax=Aeromicrobium duanguangcaii TaxID=2968086 RepID=A0ABY5KHZ7_9ACTN|nr:dynamin family protein [Aeromicrobium duanguangcaii]MCD9154597.1 dynamin family protein [Aeromicrobium duanguangcaii]MCD9155364.1 dynamin family protein [Aeromicrobium duanguangcaii]MCL3838715.1 dynamin family protein [Aeromicrobium duanguangcaii]UUI67988.1 dynamin family protein [Aeromicrobium duanguangcaii]
MTEPTAIPPREAVVEDGLLQGLSGLAAAVVATPLVLEVPGVERDRALQREVAEQLGDYVVPRLENIGAPLLVVVGGSTGAGKSTLVNSIVGRRVTATGVLRPTTRTPVLVHHPADTEWFRSGRILPEVARTGSNSRRANTIRQVACSTLWPGVAVLDAPDFDSIDETNREMAEQLLGAADLWLFVTSAARYADQVPWDYLRRASDRDASVAVVLDRTSDDALVEVRRHLARMLSEHGLSDVALFSVPESSPDSEGVLPAGDVSQVITWLRMLADDEAQRRAIVLRTLQGAILHDIESSRRLEGALARQVDAAEKLRKDVESVYLGAHRDLMTAATDGTMLRGEVLARWQDFVGSGEIFRKLERSVGSWRDRLFKRKPAGPDEVEEAALSGLHLMILDRAERAAEEVSRAWDGSEPGRVLLDRQRGLDRASRDVRVRAERIAREWREAVFELVAEQGADKKSKARALSLGVNAAGVSLMVVVFAGTAGLTGAELGIAGGTAAAGQAVLNAVFGDQAVRALVEEAARDLSRRLEDLFQSEADRYLALLPDPNKLETAQWQLQAAIAAVDKPRGRRSR